MCRAPLGILVFKNKTLTYFKEIGIYELKFYSQENTKHM